MLRNRPHSRRGFTLLELVIALAVLGLLLGGLFQLTASGARQISDQLTAQQMQLWLKATKSYLTAQRSDNTGTLFYRHNTGVSCPLAAAAATALPTDITTEVNCYRSNMLPLTSPSGGTYAVRIARGADITANLVTYATYTIMISYTGGRTVTRASMGNVANYIGAEGAAIYPAVEDTDDNATSCDESATTVRGNFGSTCINLSTFTGWTATNRPAALAFISMLDIGTGTGADENKYLWRVSGSAADFNTMKAHLLFDSTHGMVLNPTASPTASGITGLSGGINMATTGGATAAAITNVTGGINTAGGNLTLGIGGISLNGAAIVSRGIVGVTGGINTAGGNIATATGAVLTSGGIIKTEGGDLNLVHPTDPTLTGNVSARNGTFTGTLTAGSFIYTSSDRRIKKDIQPLPPQLPQLLQVHGVSYVLKSNGQKSIGVIAQDVEAVYPDLVSEHSGIKQVNYQGLVGPIIEALRELKAENDNLKQRIGVLEQASQEKAR